MRPGRVLPLLPLLLALPVAAQSGCPPPDLVLSPGPRVLEPGAREILDVFVQNRHHGPVLVELNASAPAGWRALLEDDRVTLGARTPARANGTLLKLSVLAPQRGAGVAAGEVAVVGRAECAGAASPPSAAAVAVRLAEAPTPGLLLGVGALLTAAAAVAAWRVRRTRPLVRFSCTHPEQVVVAGRGASFPLRLENVRSRPETVTFRLDGIPLGWTAFLPLTEARLEPGETKDLWLLVRPAPYARPGAEAHITVRAIPRAADPLPPILVVARVGNP